MQGRYKNYNDVGRYLFDNPFDEIGGSLFWNQMDLRASILALPNRRHSKRRSPHSDHTIRSNVSFFTVGSLKTVSKSMCELISAAIRYKYDEQPDFAEKAVAGFLQVAHKSDHERRRVIEEGNVWIKELKERANGLCLRMSRELKGEMAQIQLIRVQKKNTLIVAATELLDRGLPTSLVIKIANSPEIAKNFIDFIDGNDSRKPGPMDCEFEAVLPTGNPRARKRITHMIRNALSVLAS